jgi:hypothetical protein
MKMLLPLLHNRKYEVLLFGLMLHLFIGIFIRDMFWYATILWPVNIIILGLAGFGVIVRQNKWKNLLCKLLFLPVMLLPIGAFYFRHDSTYFLVLSSVYAIFFGFIFWELIRFLTKPGYINADIISAAACGYLLLIEIATFLFQYFYYQDRASFKGIDATSHATTFNDMVYFSSITITSIGFGDIVPGAYYTKLLTALFGVAGQFYSVVLVGIVISKFVSRQEKKP